MASEQCCGNCRWWYRPNPLGIVGECSARVVAPSSVLRLSFERKQTYKSQGTDCPCHTPQPDEGSE